MYHQLHSTRPSSQAADGATTAKGPSDAKSASAAKAPASDAKSGASSGPSVSQLDIRVGTIVECKPHPDAGEGGIGAYDIVIREQVGGLQHHLHVLTSTPQLHPHTPLPASPQTPCMSSRSTLAPIWARARSSRDCASSCRWSRCRDAGCARWSTSRLPRCGECGWGGGGMHRGMACVHGGACLRGLFRPNDVRSLTNSIIHIPTLMFNYASVIFISKYPFCHRHPPPPLRAVAWTPTAWCCARVTRPTSASTRSPPRPGPRTATA